MFRTFCAAAFSTVPTVILASATLAVSGSFDFVQNRLGVENPRSLVVPGHFDYQKQALLLRAPASSRSAQCRVCQASGRQRSCGFCGHSRGRAFVLFTSYQQMRLVHDQVSLALEYPMLLQGTGPRGALLEEFQRTPNCVLFATSSFWQGVDVPGEQLSCVIIDRLPFAVPSDPVVEARIERDARGGRRSVLRLSGPAGGHRVEAGIRAADPIRPRSRRARVAG